MPWVLHRSLGIGPRVKTVKVKLVKAQAVKGKVVKVRKNTCTGGSGSVCPHPAAPLWVGGGVEVIIEY